MSHSLVVLWRLVSPEHPLLAKGQHCHPRSPLYASQGVPGPWWTRRVAAPLLYFVRDLVMRRRAQRLIVSTAGPDLLGVALPGVGLRGFPWSRPDLVESFQGVGVQLHCHSAEVRVQLLDR